MFTHDYTKNIITNVFNYRIKSTYKISESQQNDSVYRAPIVFKMVSKVYESTTQSHATGNLHIPKKA